jgi:NitT/TauT family transport system substrate-binding protein
MVKRFRSTRRRLLKGAAATIAAAVAPLAIGSRSRAQSGLQSANMQLGWITGGNQLGEVVAKRLG